MKREELWKEFEQLENQTSATETFLKEMKNIIQNDIEIRDEDINEFKKDCFTYVNQCRKNEESFKHLSHKIVRYFQQPENQADK